MKRTGVGGWDRDTGLSEVMGFVLIIAIIIAVASLYLTYGVPAQGRENEILHMNVVKDQFINYKIGLDALMNNNRVGSTVSNSFTLGSAGSYTQGTMSAVPIMSPLGSGGTFSINRRTTEPETLSITSQSLILDHSNPAVRTSFNLPAMVNYTPDHVYANIAPSSSALLNRTGQFSMTVNTTNWVATVNLTPQSTPYQWYQSVYPGGYYDYPCDHVTNANQNGTAINSLRPSDYNPVCLVPMNEYDYTGTDLTLSIIKGNIITMDDYPVHKNVRSGYAYTVDLMDSTYGLAPVTNVYDNISISVNQPLSGVTGTGNITYDFIEKTYTITPIPLGAIEYQSQNNYWIPQDYYYQMGGVFLSQVEGNNTYKLPPEITISTDDTDPFHKIIMVNIDAIGITDPYGGSVVGGNSQVQVRTTLDSIYTFPYAEGKANTKYIRIGVNTSDEQARVMWKNYFNYTAKVADLPSSTVIGTSGTESYIEIYGDDTSEYDLNVMASNATFTATMYGVGG